MAEAIVFQHVDFSYEKEHPVLKDVSFVIPEGSHVCLIGHNGSGKSTLAKLIAGLYLEHDGEILLFGETLNKKSLSGLRSRMGFVFQNPDNQFVGATVRDDIAFGPENRRIPREEMDPIIDSFSAQVGMQEYLDRAPENLSGGQKQRVAIAGVLAMNPDLIILDEATSMLDPVGKREILSLIDMMKEGHPQRTILSITHDVEEAALADIVLVMHEGKIIAQGSPEEVFSDGESLKKAHLKAPFLYRLKEALKEEGIEVPSSIKTIEQLEDYLCR